MAAAAVLDGLVCSDGVVYRCDCKQCAVFTDQHAYHDMSFESVSNNLPGYRHAAHSMIYAVDDRVLFNNYKMTAAIMVGRYLLWCTSKVIIMGVLFLESLTGCFAGISLHFIMGI